MMEVDTDRLLTAKELAELWAVNTMTVYRLVKSGKLKAVRIGRAMRFRSADIEEYLESAAVDSNDLGTME